VEEHILKVQKKQDFKLDFCQLNEMPTGHLSSIHISPSSPFFDFGLDQGQILSRSHVCRYQQFDPSEARYVVKERVIEPLGPPPLSIDLWRDLKFRKVGNDLPIVQNLENSNPMEAIEHVAVVQQWLKGTFVGVEEEVDIPYVATNAGFQVPHPSERAPVLSNKTVTMSHAIKPPENQFSNGTMSTQRASRNGSSARIVPKSLADTFSPSQPWALNIVSCPQDTGLSNGWDDNPLPDVTSGQQFPSMKQFSPPKEDLMQKPAQSNQQSRSSKGSGFRAPSASFKNERIPAGRGKCWSGQTSLASSSSRSREKERGYQSQLSGFHRTANNSLPSARSKQNMQPNKAQNKFDLLIDLEEQDDLDNSLLSEAQASSDPPSVDLMEFTTTIADVQEQTVMQSFGMSIENESLEVIDRLQPEDEQDKKVFRRTMRQRKPAPSSSKKTSKATLSTKKGSTADAIQNLKAWTLDTPSIKSMVLKSEPGEPMTSNPTKRLTASAPSDRGTRTPVNAPRSVVGYEGKWIAAGSYDSNMDFKEALSGAREKSSELFLKVKDVLLGLFNKTRQVNFVEMQIGKIVFGDLPESLKGRQLDFSEITSALPSAVTPELSLQPFTSLVSTSATDMQYILFYFGIEKNNFEHGIQASYEILCRKTDGTEVCLKIDATDCPYYGSIEDSAAVYEAVTTFATVLLHFPQRMWDARLTITDTSYKPTGKEEGAIQLLNTLQIHVPDGKELPEIIGRDGNGLFVEGVRIIAKSWYRKVGMSTSLIITRIVDLPIQRPQTNITEDSGMFRAISLEESVMVADYRLWYEVSLRVEEHHVPEEEAESVMVHMIRELERETENIVLKMDAIGLNNKGHGHMLEQKLLKKMKRKEERGQDSRFW